MKTPLATLSATACVFLLLSGCATLSKEECKQGDWYAIGVADGERGYRSARIKDHSDACSEHAVKPDHVAYENGRTVGLRSYCTARNGYETGSRGSSYHNVCPSSHEAAFLDGYQLGTDHHRLSTERRRLEKSITELEDELETKGKKLSPKQRRHIRDDIKALSRDIGSLDSDIANIEHEAERLY